MESYNRKLDLINTAWEETINQKVIMKDMSILLEKLSADLALFPFMLELLFAL